MLQIQPGQPEEHRRRILLDAVEQHLAEISSATDTGLTPQTIVTAAKHVLHIALELRFESKEDVCRLATIMATVSPGIAQVAVFADYLRRSDLKPSERIVSMLVEIEDADWRALREEARAAPNRGWPSEVSQG